MFRLLALSAALSALASGCSRNATIMRHDGWQVDAEITRSTEAFIYAQPRGAPELKIARRDIRDLDHPGNVMGVIGLSVMGAYALNLGLGAVLLTTREPDSRQAGAIVALTGAVGMLVGSGFAYWGWSLWDRSVTAAGGEDSWPSVQLAAALSLIHI